MIDARGWAAAAALLVLLAACGGGGGDNDWAPTFAKSYGGGARDQATAVQERPGGGFVFAGTVNHRGGGSGPTGFAVGTGFEGDVWVTTLDEAGDVQWQRAYGRRSIAPSGLAADSVTYRQVRAALDLDDDARPDGAWLAGSAVVRRPADYDLDAIYDEFEYDLAVTRLDASQQVLFSRRYDAGAFPGGPFFFSGHSSSEAGFFADLQPTADGGAVAVANARALLLVDGAAAMRHALFVLRLSAAGDVLASGLVTLDDEDSVFVQMQPIAGGVVITHETRDGMRLRRIDFGAGAIAPRWQRDFAGDERPYRLLVDGDAIVVAGTDGTRVAPAFGDRDDGFVIALAADDGATRWRHDLGVAAGAAAVDCAAGAAPPCTLVVAAIDADDGLLLRRLDRANGAVLSEAKSGPSGLPSALRRLASGSLQALSGVEEQPGRFEARLLRFDAALALVDQAAIALPRYPGTSNIVADVGDSWLAFDGDDTLHVVNGFGNSAVLASLDTSGADTALERGHSVLALAGSDGRGDAGFIVAGQMSLRDGDGVQRQSAWLLRLDAAGEIVWQRRYDGLSQIDRPAFPLSADLLRAAADGDLLLGAVDANGWPRVVKLDPAGGLRWSTRALHPKSNAGREAAPLSALRALPDGGALAAGGVRTATPWVARIGADGAVRWQRRYSAGSGVQLSSAALDLRPTDDGGALLAFATQRNELGARESSDAIALLRIDAEGQPVWSRRYPFRQSALVGPVGRLAPAADGGFVVATSIRDGGTREDEPERSDLLLIKVGATGAPHWDQRYGGGYGELVHSIEPTRDGGFVIAAQSDSLGEYTEAWVLRVGADGRIADACNADLGRGGIVVRDLSIAAHAYGFPQEASATAAPEVTVVETAVVARAPADVVVARQCLGSAGNEPGPLGAAMLTVRPNGAAPGVVTSTPSGIVCGTAAGSEGCAAQFPDGSLVTLRVDIGSVSRFTGWGPGCEAVSGGFGEMCSVQLNGDRTIDAHFGTAPPPPPPPVGEWRLTVTVDRIGAFVGSTDGSFACQASGALPINTCTVGYPVGRVLDLYAEPLPGTGVLFEAWQGDCAAFGAQSRIGITMDRHWNCRAVFVSGP